MISLWDPRCLFSQHKVLRMGIVGFAECFSFLKKRCSYLNTSCSRYWEQCNFCYDFSMSRLGLLLAAKTRHPDPSQWIGAVSVNFSLEGRTVQQLSLIFDAYPSEHWYCFLTLTTTGNRVLSPAGFGLKFIKMFRADFGPAYKNFRITFRVTIFFFRDVHLLCSPRWLMWVNWLWFFLS